MTKINRYVHKTKDGLVKRNPNYKNNWMVYAVQVKTPNNKVQFLRSIDLKYRKELLINLREMVEDILVHAHDLENIEVVIKDNAILVFFDKDFKSSKIMKSFSRDLNAISIYGKGAEFSIIMHKVKRI
jgi:hypothetical protein